MKLTLIATIIKLNLKPQKYGDDLYAEAFDMFMARLMRGY